MYAAFGVCLRVQAQAAWTRRGIPRGATVAGEVALVEYLDKGVFAVAGDRAGIANARRVVRIVKLLRRRVASKAGKNALAKGAQWLSTVLDALEVY